MNSNALGSPAPGTVAAARLHVQQAYAAIDDFLDDPTTNTLAQLERGLWTRLLALGCALVGVWLARRAVAHRAPDAVHKTIVVATRFGKVAWTRPVVPREEGPKVDRPADRAVRLRGSLSFGVIVTIAHLCARMAFAQARTVFAMSHEWKPSQDTTLRIVDAVGAKAQPFLRQAPVPDDDGEILVIQVDARGAPMLTPQELERRRQPRAKARGRGPAKRERRRAYRHTHPRARRTKGKKSKNAKGAVVGVLYTLRRTRDGWEGPVNKRVYATFEGHQALFEWLHAEAVRRGYGRKRTLFLADGATAIWMRQQQFFPKAQVCLDWFHVEEKLWKAGECLYREGSAALRAWVEAQKARLRRGHVQALLTTLRTAWRSIAKTGPGTRGKRTRLLRIWQHLKRHRRRLNYERFLREGWDLGTGAAEGAVRNLVELRLDGPGMRWGRERAERVLHLRCIVVNEQWSQFERYLERHLRAPLAANPLPAVAHLAKTRAAA